MISIVKSEGCMPAATPPTSDQVRDLCEMVLAQELQFGAAAK